MRIETAKGWSGGFGSLVCACLLVMWPDPPTIAKIILVPALIGFVGVWIWWFFARYGRPQMFALVMIFGGAAVLVGGLGLHYFQARQNPSPAATAIAPAPASAPPTTTTIGPQTATTITNYNAPVTVTHEAPKPPTEPVPQAQGGKGGSGEIFGSGTVIGGKGGRVGGDGRGRGGDGGGGVIHGDGMIIGGDGGSVDGSDIWYPPAQAGGAHIRFPWEDETPDWGELRPGQGGMSGGYFQKHKIVADIRAEYFRKMGTPEKIEKSKIDDVPLDYINDQLKAKGYNWIARTDDHYAHWYLYYVPSKH